MANLSDLNIKLNNIITNLDYSYSSSRNWKIWHDAYELRELVADLKEDDDRTELVWGKAVDLRLLIIDAGVTHILEKVN